MGKITIRYTNKFADDLADLIYFIESKGLIETAHRYVTKVYAFIESMKFDKVNYAYCKDSVRANAGLKCLRYNNKYTIVFYQFSDEVIITEFIPSKMLNA